jgi:hypothetical protein
VTGAPAQEKVYALLEQSDIKIAILDAEHNLELVLQVVLGPALMELVP